MTGRMHLMWFWSEFIGSLQESFQLRSKFRLCSSSQGAVQRLFRSSTAKFVFRTVLVYLAIEAYLFISQ